MADTKIANNNILSGIGGWFKNTFNAKYWDSMKFALYCLTHPLDGFWDLTHEKRGTYAAANTILFLTCFVRVISLKYTSFLYKSILGRTEYLHVYSKYYFSVRIICNRKLGNYHTL